MEHRWLSGTGGLNRKEESKKEENFVESVAHTATMSIKMSQIAATNLKLSMFE